MKMKEVLNQTGLTDRAVRLYIDSGLVSPDIEENYSGRKNIEFSQADIDRLKNIALLRKIGFSIPDIKGIAEGGENTKSIIEAFIQQKQESVQHDTLVLEKLKSLSLDTQITMVSLCTQLSSAAENKQVPQEDLQLTWIEKLEKRGIDFWGAINIVVSSAAIVLCFVTRIKSFVHVDFSNFIEDFLISISGLLCILILSVVIIVLNRKNAVSKKKKSVRRFAYGFCYLAIVPCWIPAIIFLLFSLMSGESKTQDIEDYLVLDSWVEENFSDRIELIFPHTIPESVIAVERSNYSKHPPFTTRYYYFHNYILDPCFDIAAQWKLPEDEYEIEKTRIASLNSEKAIIEKGDWICFYFEDINELENWNDEIYTFLIFAYNDKTDTVRYILSHCVDSLPSGPYYLSMDW